jgi:hypothetical protein
VRGVRGLGVRVRPGDAGCARRGCVRHGGVRDARERGERRSGRPHAAASGSCRGASGGAGASASYVGGAPLRSATPSRSLGTKLGGGLLVCFSSTPAAYTLSWCSGASRAAPARGIGGPGRAQARRTGVRWAWSRASACRALMRNTSACHASMPDPCVYAARVRTARPFTAGERAGRRGRERIRTQHPRRQRARCSRHARSTHASTAAGAVSTSHAVGAGRAHRNAQRRRARARGGLCALSDETIEKAAD